MEVESSISSGSAEIINSTFVSNTVRGWRCNFMFPAVQMSRFATPPSPVIVQMMTIIRPRASLEDHTLFWSVTLHNTVVAGNFNGTGDEIHDIGGAFSSDSSHNLIGERDSGVAVLNNGTNGNIVGDGNGGDLPIGSIFDQIGGEFLAANSPAVNAGSNAEAIDANGNLLTTDQFGNARIQFRTVDIGSRESALDAEIPSFFVTTNSDDVDRFDFQTSLREAINLANSTPGHDRISFATTLQGETITLDGSQLEVTDSVSIDGRFGADSLTISGNGLSRIFSFGSTDATYTITDVTLTDGEVARGDDPSPTEGGAIRSTGAGNTLIIDRVVISSSAANGGGAVFIAGDGAVLQISDSALINNEANFNGSAVLASGSVTTTIVNSTVSGNTSLNNVGTLAVQTGGTQAGELTLRNVTVNDNTGNGLRAIVSSGATASITVGNSIVAGSSGANLGLSGSGASFNSLGNNLFSDLPSVSVLPSDLVETDPLLAPLEPRGGTETPVHGLQAGSLARNGGNNDLAVNARGNALFSDQRSTSDFRRIIDGIVDIGAVEAFEELPSLVVTTISDVVNKNDFETSLREAIDAANNTPGLDTITFTADLAGETITLDGSQIEVTDSVTIQGLGADQLTISGAELSRIFSFGSDDDATYTIADVTLTDGEVARGDEPSPETGGAIFLNNPGDTLIIERSVISNSAANGGGAVYVEGDWG